MEDLMKVNFHYRIKKTDFFLTCNKKINSIDKYHNYKRISFEIYCIREDHESLESSFENAMEISKGKQVTSMVIIKTANITLRVFNFKRIKDVVRALDEFRIMLASFFKSITKLSDNELNNFSENWNKDNEEFVNKIFNTELESTFQTELYFTE